MLTITAVSAGAVDYLLRGSGCAEHEHEHAQKHTPEQGHELGAKHGVEHGVESSHQGAGYLVAGAEKESAGVWWGAGLDMVGMVAGVAATEEQVRAVFGRLEHPTRVDEHGDAVSLGNRPRNFRSVQDRIDAALAAEPDAGEERKSQIVNQIRDDGRKAVAYYDLTFAPVKSVSVYWAYLVTEGRTDEAAAVVAAHQQAVAEAMKYVEQEASFVRSGYHGKTASGRSVGVYERGAGLVATLWDHSTSRAQQPQLHTHVAVLNRLMTLSDGVVRALDGKGFRPIKQGADAIYRQTYERLLTASNGVVFALRPDGKAREIMGYDQQLLAKASSRARQVMGELDKAVAAFEEAYGRSPSPAQRKEMWNKAKFVDRPEKTAVGPGQQLMNWAGPLRAQLARAHQQAGRVAAKVARFGHPDQQGYTERSREQLLAAAVAGVQVKYSTWEVGNLIDAIAHEQDRTPGVAESSVDLANEVLRNGDRYGVVLLTAPDPGPVPAAVAREDGKSKYRPQNQERYTTTGQVNTEVGIVMRARTGGAPVLVGPLLEVARVELEAAGLGPDQAAAVLQILSSGRRGDVLIGPAGAGKSRTVGALARVWEGHIGGRVLGLATSQIATQVLGEDGLAAMNTTVFRNRFTPDEHGRVAERIGRWDLVILDEAGMSSTPEMDVITALVAAGGGKIVFTGDHEQLASVEAGGMLELLVRDNGAAELTEIHRFHHAWERDASVRLRAGDSDVLAVYAEHGRIRGGTLEEMTSAAVRGYLADTLDGHTSLLVVRENGTATELSAQIRAELVRAGTVSAEVLGETSDGNLIGVGDRLQARRNDHTIRVDGAGSVTNKDLYEVLGRDQTGEVRVRDKNGLVAHLPASYLAADVTLAYAVTSYAAQGVNVWSSHDLVQRGTDKAGVYVPGTRGRESNTFYVECQLAPDHHTPERLDSTAIGVLQAILTRRVDGRVAAELTRRDGVVEGRSLAWVGTQWDLLTAEYSRDRYTDTLTTLLGTDRMDQVVAESGYRGLMGAVRGAELAGHDPRAVLADAVGARSLRDANSVSDVLRHRVRLLTEDRTPEREVASGDWTALTTPLDGPVGDYARTLAEVATGRQTELGTGAALDPPGWALESAQLGAPPAEQRQYDEWVRRAGIVAAYRDLRSIPADQLSIGPAPDRGQEFHHALWQQAHAALGRPADVLDYAMASDTELREMRAAWAREQTFAPAHVAAELEAARVSAEDYRRDAVLWKAGVEQLPAGSVERREAERDLAAAERLAGLQTARAQHLEGIQALREDWFGRSEPVRDRAQHAGDELERRGQDRDRVTPAPEQVELFPIIEPDPQSGRARSRAERRVDPDQQQLHLDGVPIAGRGHDTGRDQRRRSEPTVETPAKGAAAEIVGAVPVEYQAAFDAAEKAAQADRQQPALFPVEPAVADVAAAEPLRTPAVPEVPAAASTAPEPAAAVACGDAEPGERAGSVTVGEAARHAAIAAALRAELDAATAAAAERHTRPTPSRDDDGNDIGVDAPTLGDQHEQSVDSHQSTSQGHGLRP